MAGPELVDRYKRYKSGTAKIVNYIATAARRYREVTDIVPSLAAAKKATKQAKKNPAKASDADTQVKITTAQLTSLAEIIAKSSTTVPEWVFSILDDVIAGRKDCAALYANDQHSEASIDQQNNGHQYFIDVLKRVKGLLAQARGVDNEAHKKRQRERYEATTDATNLSNPFAGLKIEEPSATPLGEEPTDNSKLHVEVSFKLQDSAEDTAFAIWCFLQDMYDLRQHVKELWLEYDAGGLSFTAASLATETAFSIMRYADEEFIKLFPEFQKLPHRAERMGLFLGTIRRTCFAYFKRADHIPNLAGSPSRNADNVIAELVCPQALYMLIAFRCKMGPNALSAVYPAEEQQEMLDLHPFGEVLEQLIPDVEIACSECIDELKFRLFFHGLMQWRKGNMPSWVVIVCQTYIDVWNVIGRNPSLDRRELNNRLTQGLRNGQAYKSMSGLDEFEKHFPEVSKCFSFCQRLMTYCMQHAIKKAFESKDNDEATVSLVAAPVRRHLVDKLPLYGASLAWTTLHMTYQSGILLCNGPTGVLEAAHLYKTCLRAGLLTSRWIDMDFVIDTHSKKQPLVLESRDGIRDMAKNYAVALGASPVIFNGNKRPVLPRKGRRNKKLEMTFPLLRVMWEGNYTQRTHMENVTAALRCAALVEPKALHVQREKVFNLPETALPATLASFTPTQLLGSFKDAFVESETDLNFNYTGFYTLCLELLSEVRMACERYFLLHPPRAAPDWNLNRTDLVYAILWDAEDAGNDELNRNCSPALSSASKILSQFIEKCGRKFHDTAVQLSSGHKQPPSSNNEYVHTQAKDFPDFGKLLELYDCPLSDRSKIVFCRSVTEFEDHLQTVKSLIALGKKYVGDSDLLVFTNGEISNILRVLEKSAAASIRSMNETEEIKSLELFADLYLTVADTELEDQASELCGFVARNYSASARQYLKRKIHVYASKDQEGSAQAEASGIGVSEGVAPSTEASSPSRSSTSATDRDRLDL